MERADLGQLLSALARGLGRALAAGAAGRLADDDAEVAAREILEGRGVSPEVERLFAGRPVVSLVSFDADRIQSWVFASERVPVAKGASLTLDDLNRRVPEMVAKVAGVHGVVYSAGGGGMLFATGTDDLKSIEREVRDWLEHQSHELTFTVTSLPLYAADLRPSTGAVQVGTAGHGGVHRFEVVDGVQGALVRMQVLVRQMKEARPREGGAPPQLRPRAGSAADRCPSCGRRPPAKPPGEDDGPETWCGWCRGLYRASRDLSPVLEGKPRQDEAVPTFSDLAGASNRGRRYLAFAAIDGNGMGAIVQSLGTFLELAAFSRATTEVFDRARKSIVSVLERGFLEPELDPERAHLSLLSGGDEVTFVLPSAPAPLAVLEALGEIEAGFDAACGPGGLLHEAFGPERKAVLDRLRQCGAGAGLVLAHPHYPVRLLRLYAQQLQKEAKRAEARSSVAWRLLTDSSPLVEDATGEQPTADLPLDAFRRLLHEAESAIRVDLPASALRGVVDQIRHEDGEIATLPTPERERTLPLLAANFFRYQLARSEALRRWWIERSRGDEPSGTDEDDIVRWFALGGTHRLTQVLDLLALEPDAREEGRRAS